MTKLYSLYIFFKDKHVTYLYGDCCCFQYKGKYTFDICPGCHFKNKTDLGKESTKWKYTNSIEFFKKYR